MQQMNKLHCIDQISITTSQSATRTNITVLFATQSLTTKKAVVMTETAGASVAVTHVTFSTGAQVAFEPTLILMLITDTIFMAYCIPPEVTVELPECLAPCCHMRPAKDVGTVPFDVGRVSHDVVEQGYSLPSSNLGTEDRTSQDLSQMRNALLLQQVHSI